MAEPTEALILDYAQQARQLLPRGLIWAIRSGTTYAQFLEGVATEFARLETRAAELEFESDPRTTTELLIEWERNLGIPGNCGSLGSTTIIRRAVAAAKLASQGGQSREYFIGVALQLGWAIQIEEHCPPGIGSPCNWGAGRGLAGAGWPWTWTVHAPPAAFEVFEAGQSAAGDPITSLNLDELLECTLQAIAPAHTVLLFEYDLPPAHEWGPWGEIPAGTSGLEIAPLSPVVTNPY